MATDQRARDLEPLARRIAGAAHRKMPASVDIQDVQQDAWIAAWKADNKFDGRGSRDGFVAKQAKRGVIDRQRETHPAKRTGLALEFTDVDDAYDLAGPDDPAGRLEHAREFEARMSALPKAVRKQVEGVLSGDGKHSEKLLSLVANAPKRRAAPAAFDPDSVIFDVGGMPPPKIAKPTRMQRLLARWPAQGGASFSPQMYGSLKQVFAKQKIDYVATKTSSTTYWVCREPSPEQRAAAKGRAAT